MKNCTGLLAALAAVSAGVVIAQDAPKAPERPAGDHPRRAEMMAIMAELSFEKIDANGDGKVTLEEFQAAMAPVIKKRFETMDANKDGVVTKEEMQQAREGRFRARAEGAARGRAEGEKKVEAEKK